MSRVCSLFILCFLFNQIATGYFTYIVEVPKDNVVDDTLLYENEVLDTPIFLVRFSAECATIGEFVSFSPYLKLII